MAPSPEQADEHGGTERVRMIIDTDETIRRAVQLRRLKMARGTTLSDVVNGVLRGDLPSLAQEFAELERYQSAPEQPRKRKPKD